MARLLPTSAPFAFVAYSTLDFNHQVEVAVKMIVTPEPVV